MLTTLRKRLATWLVAVAKRIEPKPFAFDPTFVGKEWKVRNQKALPAAWTPRDLRWISTPLCSGETHITGKENKTRLAGKPLLGVEAFWRCWQNQHLIPEELKDKLIFFDGDGVEGLLSPDGDPYSLFLAWRGGRWLWLCDWLGGARGAGCVSASAS